MHILFYLFSKEVATILLMGSPDFLFVLKERVYSTHILFHLCSKEVATTLLMGSPVSNDFLFLMKYTQCTSGHHIVNGSHVTSCVDLLSPRSSLPFKE